MLIHDFEVIIMLLQEHAGRRLNDSLDYLGGFASGTSHSFGFAVCFEECFAHTISASSSADPAGSARQTNPLGQLQGACHMRLSVLYRCSKPSNVRLDASCFDPVCQQSWAPTYELQRDLLLFESLLYQALGSLLTLSDYHRVVKALEEGLVSSSDPQ